MTGAKKCFCRDLLRLTAGFTVVNNAGNDSEEMLTVAGELTAVAADDGFVECDDCPLRTGAAQPEMDCGPVIAGHTRLRGAGKS